MQCFKHFAKVAHDTASVPKYAPLITNYGALVAYYAAF